MEAERQPAVRLRLNIINGMEQEAAWRIEEARAIAPFKSTTDLAYRVNLDEGDMKKLAQGNRSIADGLSTS